jgi:Cu+-exporting ATPase
METSQAVDLEITGMRCAGCVGSVERALASVPGVTRAEVNLATASARVSGQIEDLGLLEDAVEKAGFQARVQTEEVADRSAHLTSKQEEEQRTWLIRLVVAIPLAIGSIAAELLLPHGSGGATSVLLAGIAQVVVGWPFYLGAWASLRHGRANMDTLVALGTTVALGYSVYLLALNSHGHSYAHDSAMLLAFISLGKWLEVRARGRASGAIRSLLARTPTMAHRETAGEVVDVAASEIRLRDILIVRPGESVPTDGVVVAGTSTIDESMMTGESLPVVKSPGDGLIGGTVNQESLLRMRATRVGRETVLAGIVRLVERAQASKPNIGRLADRVAGIFVPAVLVMAAATLAGHLAWGNGVEWAIRSAVAVLVVACPCAMGLATPTAIIVATGRGAELGILVRQASALEEAGRVDTVVLDKTGTVTLGKPSVTRVVTAPDVERMTLLKLSASAASASTHPLASAIGRFVENEHVSRLPVNQSTETPGQGVSVRFDRQEVLLGSESFLKSRGADVPHALIEGSVVHVAIDGRWAGRWELDDPIRDKSAEAIATLAAMGLTVHLVTGDRAGSAARVARSVGIAEDRIRAEVLPADKERVVVELRGRGHRVAMVGDGVNDAPALARADVGFAMGQGADVAKEAGDIVLIAPGIEGVVRAVRLCRATLTKIRQNLLWAFGYNLVLIPLAAAGWLPPVMSAAAMAASSVSVVLNSLTLRRAS